MEKRYTNTHKRPMRRVARLLCAGLLSLLPLQAAQSQNSTEGLTRISNSQMGKLYKSVSQKRVAVHDPSIAVNQSSDGRKYYYVFGSHLGTAYSTDLMNWTEKYNTGRCSGLFGTLKEDGTLQSLSTFADAFHTNQTKKVKVLQGDEVAEVDFGNFDASAWNTASGVNLDGCMWAPDVIYNPHMEKWCMYLSLNGDDWRSVIVLLTSKNIAGPYVYQGPVVYSGFQWTSIPEASWKLTDLELVIGTQETLPSRYNMGSKWGERWPNVIDPTVFFDQQGELHMAYGSWSGGIYMLTLDKETGLRDYTVSYPATQNNSNAVKSDPYYGKRIAGGYYVSGEGAYIERIGDYYFLFVTNGGLTADGGYEMHIFRSQNPDGPYVDQQGRSAVYSQYMLNYGPGATSTCGEKIIGAYRWDNMELAELSQGHNSAFVDDDGRAYIIYHTRFNGGNEGHQVRVHQLFLNDKGWLVAAPYENMNDNINQDSIATRQLCTAQQIAGSYQVIQHKYKIDHKNLAYQKPFNIVLAEDGTVSGDYSGTWKVNAGTSYFSITLKGKSTYTGVIVPQTISGTTMPAVCFSATATSGENLWGSNADGRYAVDYCNQNFSSPVRALQSVKSDLALGESSLKYGARLWWESDHPEIIAPDGTLTIPGCDSTVNVKLTYTIAKDGYYYDKSYTVKVKGDGTGISPVTLDQDESATGKDNEIYDLCGHRLQRIERRGLYIVNGKKIFINNL